MSGTIAAPRPYYRRDQKDGISPPDLSKDCTFAEHIVHARGKRTRYTSISLDLTKIRDFGEVDFRLEREPIDRDGHTVVEHEALIAELQRVAREADKADRLRAVRALSYATRRREGLVSWSFDISRVLRKDIIIWCGDRIQVYFTRIR
jgi:hypothetical protein